MFGIHNYVIYLLTVSFISSLFYHNNASIIRILTAALARLLLLRYAYIYIYIDNRPSKGTRITLKESLITCHTKEK